MDAAAIVVVVLLVAVALAIVFARRRGRPEPLAPPAEETRPAAVPDRTIVRPGALPIVAEPADERRFTLRPPPWLPVTASKGPLPVVEIVYDSPRSGVSTRVVRLSSIEDDTERVYLEGHCEQRNAVRRFRADYVLKARNLDTGETIGDPVAYFRAIIRSPAAASPTHGRGMDRARPGLIVLLWVARSDNALTADEIAVLVDYAEARCRLRAPVVEIEPAMVRAWLDQQRPTLSNAVAAIVQMSERGAERPLVRDYVARLADVDGDDKGRRRRADQILADLG